MNNIKIRYDFTAKRKVPESGSLWDVKKEDLDPAGKDIDRLLLDNVFYETIIYCKKCRTATPVIEFFDIESGKEDIWIFKKINNTNNLYDLDKVFEYIVMMPKKRKETKVSSLWELTEEEKKKVLDIKVRTYNKKPVLKCPVCGESKKDFKFLTQGPEWKQENSFIHKYGIREEGGNFVLSVSSFSIFPSVNSGKLMYHDINTRIVFNTETKNIYAFPPVFKDTQKPVGKVNNRILKITHMGNVRNFIPKITENILKDKRILPYLADYLCKKNGDTMDEVFPVMPSEVFEDMYFIYDLFFYFRYPKIVPEARAVLQKLYDFNYLKNSSMQRRKRLVSAVYEMQDSPEKMLEKMKKKKIPNKKRIKKMAAENPLNIYIYRFLTKLGMKDYNVILDSIELINKAPNGTLFFIKLYLRLTSDEKTADKVKIFLQDFIKKKGDIAIKNLVFKQMAYENIRSSMLKDTANLYVEIIRQAEGADAMVEFKSIEVMHEELRSVLMKLKNKNRRIPYTKEDMRLNAIVGDYSFILAPDTYSLIECGEKMGICVGGYGDMALRRQCFIVFMVKGGKFEACIELSLNGTVLRQAKAKFNNVVPAEPAHALEEWVKENSIQTEQCSDFNLAMSGITSNNSYNYCVTAVYEDIDTINKHVNISSDYLIIDEEKTA